MHIDLFSILDTVDSTNNYAIEKIKAGNVVNGNAWFAKNQFAGKGQRGNSWESEAGKNILLSIAIKPNSLFFDRAFLFSAFVASICRDFICILTKKEAKIKWPNDLFFNDRKAGGILIENIYSGVSWDWAVVGVGINVNQLDFEECNHKTSILAECKIMYDPLILSKKLHSILVSTLNNIQVNTVKIGLFDLNKNLYKKNDFVTLILNSEKITVKLISVNEKGQLLAKKDNLDIVFNVGEVIFDI